MTRDIEQNLVDWLVEETPPREPEGLADTALEVTSRTRRLPGWLSREYWLPMDSRARIDPTWRVFIIAASLVLLSVLLVGALMTASQRTLPGPVGLADNGLLAFERDGDIWVVNEDGSGEQALIASEQFEWHPRWSRDGTKLTYWSADRPWWDWDGAQVPAKLIVADPDGGNPLVLEQDIIYPRETSWSSNGKSIAYAAGLQSIVPPRIFLVAADRPGARRVGDPELDAWAPAFSPDGDLIAFAGGNGDGEYAAYVMDAEGGEPQLVGRIGDQLYAMWTEVSWVPGGSALLAAKRSYVDGIEGFDYGLTLNVDPHASIGAVGVGDEVDPRGAWSADSKKLAYAEGDRLLTINADGTSQHSFEGEWDDVSWSPDARLVVGNSSVQTEVYRPGLKIMDPSGQRETVFIEADMDADFDWQRIAE